MSCSIYSIVHVAIDHYAGYADHLVSIMVTTGPGLLCHGNPAINWPAAQSINYSKHVHLQKNVNKRNP
jgi:hypothetical protein